jgi:hypothetical protein
MWLSMLTGMALGMGIALLLSLGGFAVFFGAMVCLDVVKTITAEAPE